MKKVFLVTKLKTTNLGNQALSMELIKLFEENVGKENLYVGGRPLGLFGYSINKLKASADPAALFESWADAVIKKYTPLKAASSVFKSRVNNFDLTANKSLRFEKFKMLFRPLKRSFDKLFLFNKQYVKRLNAINACDVFIYSGAGEASDNHVFLRQMLEIRIAQKLGKMTGAANQSVVVRDEAFKKVVKLVYGNMDRVVVRGNISKETIIETGVPRSKVFIAPDTAIKSSPELNDVKKNGMVGINFTPFIKFDYKDVTLIVEKLRQYNRDIVFVTNEPMGDIPIMEKFKADYNINVLENSADYLDFAKKIAGFEYIVGARLHTNVMALAVNVPVIAIEGLVWKTKELFEQFEYPLPSVNVNDAGWVNIVLDSIDKIEKKQVDFNSYFKNVLVKYKEDVKNNVAWINNK
ncbi:MAG: polysaccharide pyruvyl transferase family protein [Ferruginibacter sp.]